MEDIKKAEVLTEEQIEAQLESGFSTFSEQETALTIKSSSSCYLQESALKNEITRADILIPKITLVHQLSELSTSFKVGTYVYNKEWALTDSIDQTLTVCMAAIPNKLWVERLPYDPNGPRPRTFKSLEEVKALNLRYEWEGDKAPDVDPMAEILFFVVAPKGKENMVIFTLDVPTIGKGLLARFYVQRCGYRRVATKLFTSLLMELKTRPCYAEKWILGATMEKINGYNVLMPTLKSDGFWSEEQQKALETSIQTNI